jgi:ADP-ribosylglycohydrolase
VICDRSALAPAIKREPDSDNNARRDRWRYHRVGLRGQGGLAVRKNAEQATAAAVFLARTGESKDQIRDYVQRRFGYNLEPRIDDLRPRFTFEVSCRSTVPAAIIAFLESADYEHAVRLAVSLGGDSDTIACITGGIAQAYYGQVPPTIREQALARLNDELRAIVDEFEARYPPPDQPERAS